MKQFRFSAFVLLSGILWGCMGLFVRKLNEAGLYAIDVVQVRFTLSFLIIGIYLLLFRRDLLKIRFEDIWCFLGTGIFSMLFFCWCYFTGMSVASLSVMCVLLYTAPIFVMLMSAALFHEAFTGKKLLALALCFVGCCLVSGLGSDTRLGLTGLLLGLGAGFGYALYSIFSRYAINRGYNSWTITFYSFLFCSVGCAFLCDWSLIGTTLSAVPSLWVWSIAMAVFTGFLAYIFYTKGLEGMPSSKASVLASIEPVTATVLGCIVFHESLTVITVLGILLILGAVVLLSVQTKKEKST